MALNGRRSQAAPSLQSIVSPEQSDAVDGEVMPMTASALGADIPPHVWALLQDAGELAATRLVELLRSTAFKTYSAGAQRGLIELALTRAYGLPIRKALTVTLSSTDADAVAASLNDLAQSLPEQGQYRPERGKSDFSGG